MFKAKRSLGKITLLLLAGVFVTSQCYGMKSETDGEKQNTEQRKFHMSKWFDEDANTLKDHFRYDILIEYLYTHLNKEKPSPIATKWFESNAKKNHFLGLYFKTRNFWTKLQNKEVQNSKKIIRGLITTIKLLTQVSLNTGLYLAINVSNKEKHTQILSNTTGAYNILRKKIRHELEQYFTYFDEYAPFKTCVQMCELISYKQIDNLVSNNLETPFIWIPYIQFKSFGLTWGITFNEIPAKEIEKFKDNETKNATCAVAYSIILHTFRKFNQCSNWKEFFNTRLYDNQEDYTEEISLNYPADTKHKKEVSRKITSMSEDGILIKTMKEVKLY